MKKIIIWLLLILVISLSTLSPIASFAQADEEDTGTQFEPTICNAIDYSASSWFQTGENRALLTILIVLDLMNSFTDEATAPESPDFVDYSSYVGSNGIFLTIVCSNNNQVFVISYCPLLERADYAIIDKTNNGITESQESTNTLIDLLIESTLNENCSEGHYKNSQVDLLSAIVLLKKLID